MSHALNARYWYGAEPNSDTARKRNEVDVVVGAGFCNGDRVVAFVPREEAVVAWVDWDVSKFAGPKESGPALVEEFPQSVPFVGPRRTS